MISDKAASGGPDLAKTAEFLEALGELESEAMKPLLENFTFDYCVEKDDVTMTLNFLNNKLSLASESSGSDDGEWTVTTSSFLSERFCDKRAKFDKIFEFCGLGDKVSLKEFEDFLGNAFDLLAGLYQG